MTPCPLWCGHHIWKLPMNDPRSWISHLGWNADSGSKGHDVSEWIPWSGGGVNGRRTPTQWDVASFDEIPVGQFGGANSRAERRGKKEEDAQQRTHWIQILLFRDRVSPWDLLEFCTGRGIVWSETCVEADMAFSRLPNSAWAALTGRNDLQMVQICSTMSPTSCPFLYCKGGVTWHDELNWNCFLLIIFCYAIFSPSCRACFVLMLLCRNYPNYNSFWIQRFT